MITYQRYWYFLDDDSIVTSVYYFHYFWGYDYVLNISILIIDDVMIDLIYVIMTISKLNSHAAKIFILFLMMMAFWLMQECIIVTISQVMFMHQMYPVFHDAGCNGVN